MPKLFEGEARIKTAWNTACAAPDTVTDLNGQVTRNFYDPLCRMTRQNRPGGDDTTNTYAIPGTPGSDQYIYTTNPAPAPLGGDTEKWSAKWLDGFGRPYR